MKTVVEKLVEKLMKCEKELSQERGSFELFALFLREDAPDLWDLLVSASWITKNKESSIRYIAQKLRSTLATDELLRLSRIAVVEKDNPALAAIHRAIGVEHGTAEIGDSNFFGMAIKHAYIISSKREEKTTKG